MWKLYVQFLTFPSHDLPQSEPRRGKQVALGVITAQNCGICRCQDKFLSTACTGAGSLTLHLTTSETSLCSCRVQADPELWWRNSKKCDSSEKSEDLAGGTPLSVPGAKRKKKDQFLLLLLSPTSGSTKSQEHQQCSGQTLGKGPLLHPQTPLPASALQPPHGAVTSLLPSPRDGTANVPTSAKPLSSPRAAVGPPAPLNPHIPPAPGTSPAPTATEGRKQVLFLGENREWRRQLVPTLPKRSRS